MRIVGDFPGVRICFAIELVKAESGFPGRLAVFQLYLGSVVLVRNNGEGVLRLVAVVAFKALDIEWRFSHHCLYYPYITGLLEQIVKRVMDSVIILEIRDGVTRINTMIKRQGVPGGINE